MKALNLYLCGVGGQGVGFLSDLLGRACLEAGYLVRGCDTHGLAQRHGTVASHLRIGSRLCTPQVPRGCADAVIGLERLETLRGVGSMLRHGGKVLYCDAQIQPIGVRQRRWQYPQREDLETTVKSLSGTLFCLESDNEAGLAIQNAAVLGALAALELIPKVTVAVLERTLHKNLPARMLDENLILFRRGVLAVL